MTEIDEIEAGFERAWAGMLSRPRFKFRNLNQNEIAGLRGMFHDLYLAQIQTVKLAIQPAPAAESGLKDMIADGFSKMQSALANVRVSGGRPDGSKMDYPTEFTPEMLATMFEASGMKTNIDDIKMQNKSVKGTEGVADKLRRLKGGN